MIRVATKRMHNKEINTDGLMLLIDKPKDCSSAKVVNIIKKKLNVRKAGHSGTLDPKASGLMIICTQKLTKKLNEFLNSDKEYSGVMILGQKTKSFDSETEVIEQKQIEHLTEFIIRETAKTFLGMIEQIPPMYSAVKHKGKPLYKYARMNKEVPRNPRKVLINEFRIDSISLPEVMFTVNCSKGTYIRTLVNDFGDKLAVGAYLKELRRTRIGDYLVEDSVSLDEFFKKAEDGNFNLN